MNENGHNTTLHQAPDIHAIPAAPEEALVSLTLNRLLTRGEKKATTSKRTDLNILTGLTG